MSQTADPVSGGWFAYTFFLGIKNDYPKLAVWPDGYYMISQEGYDGTSSLDAWVFDRANMLNGNPATFQHPSGFPSEHDVIALPSDLTGPPPPDGSPNFYARPYDGNLYSDGSPRIEIFEFHTDSGCSGGYDLQPGANPHPSDLQFQHLQRRRPEPILCSPAGYIGHTRRSSIWPMGPLQYRNFGDRGAWFSTTPSMWTVLASSAHALVRTYAHAPGYG